MITLCLLSLLASGAARTAYDLNVELKLNGRQLSAGPLSLVENQVGEVGAGPDKFVEVRAAEGVAQGHRGIYMQFMVGTTAPDGRRTILSRPRILVNENEPATITLGDGGHGTLALSVIAKRRISRSSR